MCYKRMLDTGNGVRQRFVVWGDDDGGGGGVITPSVSQQTEAEPLG